VNCHYAENGDRAEECANKLDNIDKAKLMRVLSTILGYSPASEEPGGNTGLETQFAM